MSVPAVVLGVDVGTTATKVVAVEASGTIVHTRCQGSLQLRSNRLEQAPSRI